MSRASIPQALAAIATIVLGAAFLVQTGAMLAEYARVLSY